MRDTLQSEFHSTLKKRAKWKYIHRWTYVSQMRKNLLLISVLFLLIGIITSNLFLFQDNTIRKTIIQSRIKENTPLISDSSYIDDFTQDISDNPDIDQSSIQGVLWDGGSCYYGNGSLGQYINTSEGLVSYWEFENNFNDSTNHHFDLTQSGVSFSTGITGLGAYFDGVDNYMRMDNSTAKLVEFNFSRTQEFSLNAWVNIEDMLRENGNTLIKAYIGNPEYILEIENDGIVKFLVYNFGTVYSTTSMEQYENEWVMVTGTASAYDQITKLYIDGQLNNSQDSETEYDRSSSYPIYIGSRMTGDTYNDHFQGTIDQITIWNRSLSAKEVLRLRSKGSFESEVITTGLFYEFSVQWQESQQGITVELSLDEGITWFDVENHEEFDVFSSCNISVDNPPTSIKYKVTFVDETTLDSIQFTYNSTPPPQCYDNYDNDGDGWLDMQDPGCTCECDDDESNQDLGDCADGIDNDGDGLIDGSDPICEQWSSPTEASECSDGIDNDGDGDIDFPCDDGCSDADDNIEIDDDLESLGWTVFEESVDTQKIYVSSSDGDDRNDGLSADSPKQTLAAASSALRSGYPDWLLLKRGDIWVNETLSISNTHGRSSDERIIITSYGTSHTRPKIQTGTSGGISCGNNVAIIGLYFEPHLRTARTSPSGVSTSRENILFEDIVFKGFKDNMIIWGDNITIRRCQIIDSWASQSHRQGIYASGASNLTIEENIIDHNGWNSQLPSYHKFLEPDYTDISFWNIIEDGRFRFNYSIDGDANEYAFAGVDFTSVTSLEEVAAIFEEEINNQLPGDPVNVTYWEGYALGDIQPMKIFLINIPDEDSFNTIERYDLIEVGYDATIDQQSSTVTIIGDADLSDVSIGDYVKTGSYLDGLYGHSWFQITAIDEDNQILTVTPQPSDDQTGQSWVIVGGEGTDFSLPWYFSNALHYATATIFDHNLYMQSDNDPVTVRGNIIARASSHGLQLRPGGTVENNLFLDNSLDMFIAKGGGRVKNNVALYGKDIGTAPRGMGLSINGKQPFVIMENNIVTQKMPDREYRDWDPVNIYAYSLSVSEGDYFIPDQDDYTMILRNNTAFQILAKTDDYGKRKGWILEISAPFDIDENTHVIIENNSFQSGDQYSRIASVGYAASNTSVFTFANNTYYSRLDQNSSQYSMSWFEYRDEDNDLTSLNYSEWMSLINEQQTIAEEINYADPYRNITTYQEYLGEEANLEAFYEELRNQSRYNWRAHYTADAINNYIREGFEVIEGDPNNPPTVSDIPDQTIQEGDSFPTISLDNYVDDIEDPDEDISWSSTGSEELIVSIQNRIATITIPSQDWYGEETIFFTARDTGDLTDSDQAVFTVIDVPDPQPPQFSSITPANTSTDVSISLSNLSLIIEDPEGDSFNWTIEISPDIGNNSDTNANNGTKNCTILEGLQYATTYYWYVNATDTGSHTWTNRTYWFITENQPSGDDDDNGGSSYNPPPSNPDENNPPVAQIGGPYTGYVNYSVLFNASNSTDPDGNNLRYRWDFNNDSTWDTNWTENATTNWTYPTIGNYTLHLEVQDEKNDNDFASTYVLIFAQGTENITNNNSTQNETDHVFRFNSSLITIENNTILIQILDNSTVLSVKLDNQSINFQQQNQTVEINLPQNNTNISFYLSFTVKYENGTLSTYTSVVTLSAQGLSQKEKELINLPIIILIIFIGILIIATILIVLKWKKFFLFK